MNVFIVTFDQLKASLMNRNINYLKNNGPLPNPKTSNF